MNLSSFKHIDDVHSSLKAYLFQFHADLDIFFLKQLLQ